LNAYALLVVAAIDGTRGAANWTTKMLSPANIVQCSAGLKAGSYRLRTELAQESLDLESARELEQA